MKRRLRTGVAVCVLPLLTTACWSIYHTDIQNATSTPVSVELVRNKQGALPAPSFPCGIALTYTTKTDQYSLRETCELAPGQTMRVGSETAYFSTVPFDGDTLLVRSSTGGTQLITSKLVGDFITDTSSERRGVEGPLETTYTIRLR